MNEHTLLRPRRLAYVAVAAIAAATLGCSDRSDDVTLGPQQLSVSADTVPGTGQLSELQDRRAAWLARKINNYRFRLRISCFCGGVITRPVLVEVRNGAAVKVWDLETGQLVTEKILFPTITSLFDAAIAERSRGGFVSVAYDRSLGIPARLEVGTLANDAGTLYTVGELTPID